MTKPRPEEWRPVPGWPGYEVSSMGRVRHVRLMAGQNLQLRHKGAQLTTTAQALFTKAFGKAALGSSSTKRYKPNEFWALTRDYLKHHGSTMAGYMEFIIDYEKERFNLVTLHTPALRNRLEVELQRYIRKGLVCRPSRATYQLTDLGIKKEYPHALHN